MDEQYEDCDICKERYPRNSRWLREVEFDDEVLMVCAEGKHTKEQIEEEIAERRSPRGEQDDDDSIPELDAFFQW